MTPSRTHPNPTLRGSVVAPTTRPFHSTRGAVPAKEHGGASRRAASASSAAAFNPRRVGGGRLARWSAPS